MVNRRAKPLRVWATRPQHQNGEWCGALRAQGWDVLDLPLMSIQPITEDAEKQAVKTKILAFDEHQKVIFVSQNAVKETFLWLDEFWPQLPAGIEYFAVGKKTAEAVLAQGVSVKACNSAMNSDELLAMEELQDVKNVRVLVCRGIGGLPRLGEELTKRGAIVGYCELYERSLPEGAIKQAKSYLSLLDENDVVPLFSGETLQNFVRVLDANGCRDRSAVLVVPGQRVAALAKSFGFTRVVTAQNASSECMLQAIMVCKCL